VCTMAFAAGNASAGDSITASDFGTLPSGTKIKLYTLKSRSGMEALISTYGGILVSLKVPDRQGRLEDVVLGYDTLDPYLKNSPYFGALIGRYGNRIARGRFTLEGKSYTLATNDGPNTLHGGRAGFDKVVWKALSAQVTPEGPELKLAYLSHDGEEGYPGNLDVRATYTLTHDNSLRLSFEATTDKPTVVNLTAHSYFNLLGHDDVLGHLLAINADQFIPVDQTLIPTGTERVAGSPFDFRTPTLIGARIKEDDPQLRFAHGGYDHNWVLNTPPGKLALDATVYEPETGRVLQVLSDQPGLQFYSGNFLDGSIIGRGGWKYQQHAAFCLEPQHFPDSPNHPDFPSTELKPGETYRSTIIYRFSTR
jgi:aldose 1-epimerase